MQIGKHNVILFAFAIATSSAINASVFAETGFSQGGTDVRPTTDWVRFNPYKFKPATKLVPSPQLTPRSGNVYNKVPSFPHDPSKTNPIFGRGKNSLPTVVYTKAFDIIQLGGKYYQAPAAGLSKTLSINGQSVVIYATTFYTPLNDNRMVANPAHISPFDPSNVFYKENNIWPSIIYAEPGKQISIAEQTFTVPPAGQSVLLTVGPNGQIKDSAQSNQANGENITSSTPISAQTLSPALPFAASSTSPTPAILKPTARSAGSTSISTPTTSSTTSTPISSSKTHRRRLKLRQQQHRQKRRLQPLQEASRQLYRSCKHLLKV